MRPGTRRKPAVNRPESGRNPAGIQPETGRNPAGIRQSNKKRKLRLAGEESLGITEIDTNYGSPDTCA